MPDFFLICHLSAQTESDAPSERDKRSAFRTTSLGKWTGPGLFIREKGRWESVEMLDMGLSRPIRFSRNEPVAFFRREEKDGKETYLPVTSVSLPESCLTPLILLRVLSNGAIQHYVSDMNPANFPYGGYKLVNFTRDQVAAGFGEKHFLVKPGGTELVDPRRGVESRLPIRMFRQRKGEKPEMIYSNMVMNRPGKRMFMFLCPEEDGRGGEGGRPRVRCLVDFRQNE